MAAVVALIGTSTAAAVPLFGFNENYVLEGHDIARSDTFRPSAQRLQINWGLVEPQPGAYDWTYSDRQYRAIVAQGARPIALVMGAPCWSARIPACYPVERLPSVAPEHYNAWERFVQMAVQRYPDLAAVEVWNEPNLHVMHLPRADASRYVETLRRAYSATKAVRPGLRVLGGSLSPITTPRRARRDGGFPRRSAGPNAYAVFLDRMLKLGAGRYMDGLAFHPYPNFRPYVKGSVKPASRRVRIGFARGVRQDIRKQLATIRRLQRRHGARMPIWATETGVCTTGPPERQANLREQAVGIRHTYLALEELGMKAILFHRLWDLHTDDGRLAEGCGLTDLEGRRKPAWHALLRLRSLRERRGG